MLSLKVSEADYIHIKGRAGPWGLSHISIAASDTVPCPCVQVQVLYLHIGNIYRALLIVLLFLSFSPFPLSPSSESLVA